MKDGYETALNHLLFHKALISEEENGQRINRYLKMLHEIDQGFRITARDPLERSIAAAFELVMEHQFNPWDIDLVRFSRMYLKKVREEGEVNFVTAGQLILMAWSVLKLQSDDLLVSAEPVNPPEESFFADWDLSVDYYQESGDLDYTYAVLGREGAPLEPALRRGTGRPVTLMDLVNAFDEARKEVELQAHISAVREKAARKAVTNFGEKVHKEDLTEDIKTTWERIVEFGARDIRLWELYNHELWERITVFMSVLFLAKMGRIRLWQRDLPYGEIFVRGIAQEEGLTKEEIREEFKEASVAVV